MKQNQFSFIHFFVFFCLLTGVTALIIQKEFFTAATFAETALVLCSLVYIASRFVTGMIISKYQDFGYNPSAWKRRFDDVVVNMNVHLFRPLSVEFLCAAIILFIIKCLPPVLFNSIGDWIVAIASIETNYKIQLLLLGAGLGLLTWLKIISLKVFRSYRKVSGPFVSSLKVACILAFFLVADQGLSNRAVEYVLHKNPGKGDALTINSASARDVQIRQAVQDYISLIVELMHNEELAEAEKSDEEEALVPRMPLSVVKLFALVNRIPAESGVPVKNFTANSSGIKNLEWFSSKLNHTDTWKEPVRETHNSELYRKASAKERSFFDNFAAFIKDERETIRKVEPNEYDAIMKGILNEMVGEFFPFTSFGEGFSLHKVFRDKPLELLQEKLVGALYHFFSSGEDTKHSFRRMHKFFLQTLRTYYNDASAALTEKVKLTKQYYAAVQQEFVQRYFTALDQAKGKLPLSLSEGFRQRIISDNKILQRYLNLKADTYRFLREQYPHLSELSDNEIRDALTPEGKKRMNDLDKAIESRKGNVQLLEALASGEQTRSFETFRDKLSPGGLFFGNGVALFDVQGGVQLNPCSGQYIPAVQNCPTSILRENVLSLMVQGGKLKLRTNKGVFEYAGTLNPKILLAAYRYVYDSKSYPAIIDAFYDTLGNKVYAYNDVLRYDDELMDIFRKADEFIFGALRSDISSDLTEGKFEGAKPTYTSLSEQLKITCSRIYDQPFYITTNGKTFNVHSNLMYSLASTQDRTDSEIGAGSRYHELTELSGVFNQHKGWIQHRFKYMDELNTFAVYQALFRAVRRDDVDLSELLVGLR
jgi:hypothetical protein